MVKGERKKKAEDVIGEGEKVKKVRTAPTNTSLLPPCRVCGEPAAGFHYGANTCEACKGFFRRTLVRGRGYKCVNGDEKCDILQSGKQEKSKICAQCRHLKCLAVGMSTEAIKTGRYTHAKRTQDILEYKQVMDARDSPNQPSDTSSPVSESITTAVPSCVTPITTLFSSTSVTVAEPSCLTSVATSVPSSDNAQAASHSTMTPVPSGFISHDLEWSHSDPFSDHPSYMLLPDSVTYSPQSFKGLGTSPERPGSAFAYSAIPSNDTSCQGSTSCMRLTPSAAFPGSAATFEVMQNVDMYSVLMDEGRCCMEDPAVKELGVLTPVSCLSSDQGVLTPESSLSSPVGGTYSGWEGGSAGGSGGGSSSGDLSDEECRQLTEHLLQSHSSVHSCKFTLTPEQMLDKQKSCYEKCEAHMEAFGFLGHVSEEEYQDIYRATGIDVDDRQLFMNQFAQLLDKNIREHISFVKTIPGFSSLSVRDQIRLIKNSRCEASLVFQADGYNEELDVITMPSGGTFCHHQLEKVCGKERVKMRCRSLQVMKKLGLCDSEKVLVKCLIVFTLGHDDLDDPETVSAIEWRMAQCLLWLMRENGRPQPTRFFSRIISSLCLVKELTGIFHEWVKCQPFAHYACFKNNKLLAEWFSSS